MKFLKILLACAIVTSSLNTYAISLRENKCTYNSGSRELLWRCSLKNPGRSLNRVQAIDFSTMIFGLSTLEPRIGNNFYKIFSAR